jgi:hypothetical protein
MLRDATNSLRGEISENDIYSYFHTPVSLGGIGMSPWVRSPVTIVTEVVKRSKIQDEVFKWLPEGIRNEVAERLLGLQHKTEWKVERLQYPRGLYPRRSVYAGIRVRPSWRDDISITDQMVILILYSQGELSNADMREYIYNWNFAQNRLVRALVLGWLRGFRFYAYPDGWWEDLVSLIANKYGAGFISSRPPGGGRWTREWLQSFSLAVEEQTHLRISTVEPFIGT